MDREEQIAHLRLIRTPNIDPMTFSLLLQRYGSAAAALDAVTSNTVRKVFEAKRINNGGFDFEARLFCVEPVPKDINQRFRAGFPDLFDASVF